MVGKVGRGEKAQQYEMELATGWTEYRQALELLDESDWSHALTLFAEAELVFQTHNEQHGLWRALIGQALLHWREGAIGLAIVRATSALRAAQAADDGYAVGCVAWQIANMELGQGNYCRTAELLDHAQLALDAVGIAPPGGILAAAARVCTEIARWQELAHYGRIAPHEAEATIAELQNELVERLGQAATSVRSAPLFTSHNGSFLSGHFSAASAELLALPMTSEPRAGFRAWLSRLWRRLVSSGDAMPVETLMRVSAADELPASVASTEKVAPAVDETDDAILDTQPAEQVADVVAQPEVESTFVEAAKPESRVQADAGADEAATADEPEAATLVVHILGSFQAKLNGQTIDAWPSGRGRAIFKYMLTHRERPIPRDVLMDLFWPDAGQESARNSLNVALHGLRQALRTAADAGVVIFQNGAYRLNPDLKVWIDIEEFQRAVRAGLRSEDAGDIAAAVASYETAAALYAGDFMADDLYDEWPALFRERLRVAYLDTLDRLSHLYFDQAQYTACVNLCQLILSQDRCREDAHCRLMRCYSRQGQPHLALRQYQTCSEALQDELGVEPAPPTTQLYERVRRHEDV